MAPLLKKYKLEWAYLLFGMLALIADFYKWPIENFPIAFYLMGIALLLLLGMVIRIVFPPNRPKSAVVSQ